MFKKLIVPVDGSTPSTAAVSLALHLARDEGAAVTFVHVIEVAKLAAMTSPSSIDPAFAIESAQLNGKEILAEAAGEAAGTKVAVSTALVEGDTVPAILELAVQKKADLIVVGSHGRGGLSRALLGSVAEGLLRRSSIPVLVTHAPQKR